MANLTNPRKARNMDDQAATKVIAAIERLSNRIAKLDETSVEAAAIANEARRAAMDAADATSPKQTAKHLSTHIKPVIGKFDGEFRASMDQMNDIVGQLLGHAQLIATGAIGFSVVAITLLVAWIFHDQLLRSRWGCGLFGGMYEWTLETGRFCIIAAR